MAIEILLVLDKLFSLSRSPRPDIGVSFVIWLSISEERQAAEGGKKKIFQLSEIWFRWLEYD